MTMMSSDSNLQQSLLQAGLKQIETQQVAFSTRFYEKLFQMRPDVQALFEKTDMQKQQQMLISALILIVKNVQNPMMFSTILKNLGERHIGYGTVGHCFSDMGQALVQTFRDFIGPDWSLDQEKAWLTAFEEINRIMIEGIAQAQSR